VWHRPAPVGTVQRLDYPEVERLIRSAYGDSSANGVMIEILFLTGARVNEFVHIRVEDLHLDDESMRKKNGKGSSVSVIKCSVKSLTFFVNALADGFPAQCGWGRRPAVAAKIAVSKSII
jgi:site-specific recombinase XerD